MSEAWPHLLASWVTPELAVQDWQARLARVETQETAHFAHLPYMTGLAVIGSVGRGTAWPLSDLDLFAMADVWEREDPEDLLRREEEHRNHLLRARGIPNDLEIAGWVLTTEEVRAALDADDAAFLQRLAHPHWLGLVLKADGARVSYDPHGFVRPFLDRCQRMLWDERFLRVWQSHALAAQRTRLEQGRIGLCHGNWSGASFALLQVDRASACYARWRALPQSLTRGVSRLLAASEAAGEPEFGDLYLTAHRLRDEQVWARFDAVPPEGKRERDVWWKIRRASEDITGLAATRDILHVSSWFAIGSGRPGPWPAWTGVTGDEAAATEQYVAAREMLRRLSAGNAA